MSRSNWKLRAECRKIPDEYPEDLDLFFPPEEDPTGFLEAIEVYCDQCPVRGECLDYAIQTGSCGVWGGYFITYQQSQEIQRIHPLDAVKLIVEGNDR